MPLALSNAQKGTAVRDLFLNQQSASLRPLIHSSLPDTQQQVRSG